jgi:predicted phage tail protein
MRVVKLYGELGRRFGREFRLDVVTPAEAVRALCAVLRGFEQALRGHPHGFHVLAGRRDVAERERLLEPAGEGEPIKIVPATAGSKKGGILQTIIGVALVVVGFVTGQAWLVQIGAALALGGVAQMLTPTPKTPGSDSTDTAQSYYFSGPVNTSVQGGAVPVGYGRMIVGSSVISMGLSVQELPT